jgi:N4-gp56 family major capsid protein
VITALGTGTGGNGTYTVSISQTVGAAAISGNIVGIRNTTGAVDVYPVLFFARDAYGLVPLKGATSLTPMVVNPKPSVNDPLGQRGTVGWKTMQGAIILNDAWMARLEVGASS